jgi:O-antigen ligase
VVLSVAAVAWLATAPVSSGASLRRSASVSAQSRQDILKASLKAMGHFMPLGSGVGSFERAYALYEDRDGLDPTTYVNHAHDDYAEIVVETGLPGILAIALFLAWWGRTSWAKWRAGERDPYGAAAIVASAAMLIHSLVDFPLRTAALSACFAMCLALIARSRPPAKRNRSQLWTTRHVVIG